MEKIKVITNGEINRLGESIYKKKGVPTSAELELLQEFRTSFSQPLVDTFNSVRHLSNIIHTASIVAFRLKRISTIINKIEREPGMKLSRMGDIAGVRSIFYNETEVYKALELIKENFKISGRIRDYIENPNSLGYRGVHVYIIDEKSNKRIEIQLRTITHHNWATLVEITDLLFDLRLKELGYKSDKDFAQFHALMSSDKELTEKEANLIYRVLNKWNLITVLSNTFRKNNNEVKMQWSDENRANSFFLLEASRDKIPNLQSFKTFEEAENEYFLKYKQNLDVEIVLTSIRKPNFKQISIAYANYILSYHTFINDVQPIIEVLALEAIEDKQFFKFKKIFKTYEDLQANILFDVLIESADIYFNKLERKKIILKTNKKMTKKQEKEIENDLKQKFIKHKRMHNEFMKEIDSYMPTFIILRKLFVSFIKKSNKRVNRLLKYRTIEFVKQTTNKA